MRTLFCLAAAVALVSCAGKPKQAEATCTKGKDGSCCVAPSRTKGLTHRP